MRSAMIAEPKVYVVDDDPEMRQCLRHLMS